MIDSSRRNILATGAAAAAANMVSQGFAETSPTAAVTGLPDGAKVGFIEKGDVRLRYAEIGSGFPLLAIPGGGLNSCIAFWTRMPIDIQQAYRNDFRIIHLD